LSKEERGLVKRLVEFPGVVAEATERRGPHAIPVYAIRLADDFHRFYHHHRVLGSEQQGFRLGLCQATQSVIARCLDLVGVEAPERM
jgi:arginyl-tRNA synthetase